MKRSIAATLAAPMLLAGLAGCMAIAPAPEPLRPVDPVAFRQEDALAAVNAFRAANGVSPLRTETRLVEAAQAQADAMAAKNSMDHYVDGPLGDRIKRFRYAYATAAENIARGQPDFSAAMAGWERSPGHRRNLLDPKLTEAGFAAAREEKDGRIFWAQVFAHPRPQAPAISREPRFGPTLSLAGLPVPLQ